MDWDIGENLPFILSIIVVVVLQFIFIRRRRKPETTHPEIVQSLLSEIKLNHALAELFEAGQKLKKFEAVSWQRNKGKLDFLDQSIQVTLSDAYMMIEDFNQQIIASKKYRSSGYMASIDMEKLKVLLTKGREGLEEWFLRAVGENNIYSSISRILY